MEIRLSSGMTLETRESYIRVDFYKTKEAYFNPEEHEGDIWTCACRFNFDELEKTNDISVIDRLLSVIEACVNGCLNQV